MAWLLLEERDARRISVWLSVWGIPSSISPFDPTLISALPKKRLIDLMQGLNQDLLVTVWWAIY